MIKTLLLVPAAFAALTTLPTSAPAPAAGDHDWVVDGVHSSVIFKVKHANCSWFYGAFKQVAGSVALDPSKPEAGSISVEIAADSVDTRDEKRDGHLKGPDFLNVKENPKITFTSSKIAKKGDGFEVTGELSLVGKKKPLTVLVTKVGEGEFMGARAGFETSFTIKRSDFGIDYGVAQKALGDEVTVMLALETTKKK